MKTEQELKAMLEIVKNKIDTSWAKQDINNIRMLSGSIQTLKYILGIYDESFTRDDSNKMDVQITALMVKCDRCDGEGKISLGDGWTVCPKCSGNGRTFKS